MKPLKIYEIKNAVKGNIIRGNPDLIIDNICTDSRTAEKGDLFIPLKGEKHDAHKFVVEAVAAGAESVIVDREPVENYEAAVIKVEDTNKALQDLANYYRNQFKDLKIVAVTGSSGKTTTKDMIASILKKKYNVVKTEGNLNNYFGLPLTLLDLKGDEDVAVLEMGMSKPGEIKLLTEIAEPDIGVITNVGPTHLEFLKTVENVARGKGELIAGLPENGIAVLNYDNKYVREMKECFKGNKIIYYSLGEGGDIRAKNIKVNKNNFTTSFTIDFQEDEKELNIYKPGKHNIYNALAAIAVARELEVGWPDIEAGLMSDKYTKLRQEIKNVEDFVIINDTYNANPMSMRAAINVLVDIADKRTVAVLGAMLELGSHETKEHKKLGEFVVDIGVDVVITVGEQGKQIARGVKAKDKNDAELYEAKNNQQAVELIQNIIKTGDTLLVKGSRGNRMEEIVNTVCRQGG